MNTQTLITCEQCKQETEHDPTDGLPDYWAALPIARSGESIDYISHSGGKYTSQNVGSDAYNRPHIYLCPACCQELWPWA